MLEISNIGLLTAFAAGVISFLSPCVLPLVPGYISYIAGDSYQAAPTELNRGMSRLPALFTDSLVARLKQMGALGVKLRLVAGGALIVMGLAMITGQLFAFSYWLLDAFPPLANIG